MPIPLLPIGAAAFKFAPQVFNAGKAVVGAVKGLFGGKRKKTPSRKPPLSVTPPTQATIDQVNAQTFGRQTGAGATSSLIGGGKVAGIPVVAIVIAVAVYLFRKPLMKLIK